MTQAAPSVGHPAMAIEPAALPWRAPAVPNEADPVWKGGLLPDVDPGRERVALAALAAAQAHRPPPPMPAALQGLFAAPDQES